MVARVGRLPHPVSDAATVAVVVGYLIGEETKVPAASIVSLSAR
jgi:hypothetical protein